MEPSNPPSVPPTPQMRPLPQPKVPLPSAGAVAPVPPPSAVRVLQNPQGDCNEAATLFVALARSTGLPARTVSGLLYLDGRFYYHAWAEVYLSSWVPVDPTYDQFPADAAHLRFATGGLARQVELLPLIGRLKLEVL